MQRKDWGEWRLVREEAGGQAVHKGSAKALSWSLLCWGFALESNSGFSEVPVLAIH